MFDEESTSPLLDAGELRHVAGSVAARGIDLEVGVSGGDGSNTHEGAPSKCFGVENFDFCVKNIASYFFLTILPPVLLLIKMVLCLFNIVDEEQPGDNWMPRGWPHIAIVLVESILTFAVLLIALFAFCKKQWMSKNWCDKQFKKFFFIMVFVLASLIALSIIIIELLSLYSSYRFFSSKRFKQYSPWAFFFLRIFEILTMSLLVMFSYAKYCRFTCSDTERTETHARVDWPQVLKSHVARLGEANDVVSDLKQGDNYFQSTLVNSGIAKNVAIVVGEIIAAAYNCVVLSDRDAPNLTDEQKEEIIKRADLVFRALACDNYDCCCKDTAKAACDAINQAISNDLDDEQAILVGCVAIEAGDADCDEAVRATLAVFNDPEYQNDGNIEQALERLALGVTDSVKAAIERGILNETPTPPRSGSTSFSGWWASMDERCAATQEFLEKPGGRDGRRPLPSGS